MLHHLPLRLPGAAAHEQGDRLDVALLARRLGRRGGAGGLRRSPGRREPLLEEHADRRTRVRQRQAGVQPRRLVERVAGPRPQPSSCHPSS